MAGWLGNRWSNAFSPRPGGRRTEVKFYSCVCQNTLFFENSRCVACDREVGWCPACRAVRALEPADGGRYHCADPSCAALLVKCANYVRENVCNRCVQADPLNASSETFCDYCRFNETIPDLSVPGNHEKWARIEAAKRRLFYILDVLGLPYGTEADGFDPPLAFDFKGDLVPKMGLWRTMGREERVYTGHSNGKITINIREADDAEREKLRVDLGEAQRTVIGHFRHEIGHYYWDLLIRGRCEEECKRLFGDHENPSYGDSLERHYSEGPPANWQECYLSAYATMHPWEDWAETFAHYLDMVSIVETAASVELVSPVAWDDFDTMLRYFHEIGVVANELNRTMGLIDLIPEVITEAVEEKLRFVHKMVRSAAAPGAQTQSTASSEPSVQLTTGA